MTEISVNDLDHLRFSAKRLERYSQRAREHIWTGNRSDLVNALADLAETSEIARRLYTKLQDVLHTEG
jgi:hypothetical protein